MTIREEESARKKQEQRDRWKQERQENKESRMWERGTERGRTARLGKERKERSDRERAEYPETKMWQKGAFQAQQVRAKKEADERMTRETVLGHLPGPAMDARKEIDKERRETQKAEGAESKMWERGTERGRTARLNKEDKDRRDREKSEYPETKMWEKGTRDARQARLKGEATRERQDSVERGELPGETQEDIRKQSKVYRTTEQRDNVADREREQDRAREEGRIGPKATEQREAEMRREKSEGRVSTEAYPIARAPIPLPEPSTLPKPTEQTPTIPATGWNKAVDTSIAGYWGTSHMQDMGGGANLPHGRISNRTKPPAMRHPWQINPFWDSEYPLTKKQQEAMLREKGAWCVNVVPGFLNGHPPAVSMKGGFLPKGAKVYGTDYKDKDINPDGFYQVLLTDEVTPFITCTDLVDSRAKVIGGGLVKQGEVPLFLRARGAMKATPLDESDALTNFATFASENLVLRILDGDFKLSIPVSKDDGLPEGNRLCYKCDIVLQVDKPSVKQIFEPDDIGLLRAVGFDVVYPARTQYGARLYEISTYIPPKEPTVLDVVSGTFIEYPYDDLVIGQLYLLSPVFRDLANNIPDGSWLAYTRGQVFWNLNYASVVQIDPLGVDRSLDYFKQILGVLAGGVAVLIAYSYVNPIEAQYNKLLTVLNQTSARGSFWTG